jgi:hypothetical protein
MAWDAEMSKLADAVVNTFGDACTIDVIKRTRSGYSAGKPTYSSATISAIPASRGRVEFERFGQGSTRRGKLRYVFKVTAFTDLDGNDVIRDTKLTGAEIRITAVHRSVDNTLYEVECEFSA